MLPARRPRSLPLSGYSFSRSMSELRRDMLGCGTVGDSASLRPELGKEGPLMGNRINQSGVSSFKSTAKWCGDMVVCRI